MHRRTLIVARELRREFERLRKKHCPPFFVSKSPLPPRMIQGLVPTRGDLHAAFHRCSSVVLEVLGISERSTEPRAAACLPDLDIASRVGRSTVGLGLGNAGRCKHSTVPCIRPALSLDLTGSSVRFLTAGRRFYMVPSWLMPNDSLEKKKRRKEKQMP